MNRIVELRRQQGLTQSELAAKIGISQNTLSQYETGVRPVSSKSTLRLSNYFSVSPAYLLGQSDKRQEADAEEKPFQITDVKEIVQEITTERVNLFLQYGWVLLYIGEEKDSHRSTVVYTLGRTSDSVKSPISPENQYEDNDAESEWL